MVFCIKRYAHFFRGRFNTTLYFCYIAPRDFIEAVPCHSGWSSNFELYGGINQSNETITIYNYVSGQDGQWSTNLFLRNDIDLPDYLFFHQVHYIPGKTTRKIFAFDCGCCQFFFVQPGTFPPTNVCITMSIKHLPFRCTTFMAKLTQFNF